MELPQRKPSPHQLQSFSNINTINQFHKWWSHYYVYHELVRLALMEHSNSHLFAKALQTRFITLLVTILEYRDLFPWGIQAGVEVILLKFALLRSLYVYINLTRGLFKQFLITFSGAQGRLSRDMTMKTTQQPGDERTVDSQIIKCSQRTRGANLGHFSVFTFIAIL